MPSQVPSVSRLPISMHAFLRRVFIHLSVFYIITCSSHFKSDVFNESGVLHEKLMPDTKVVIRLKANVFPTIYKTKSDKSDKRVDDKNLISKSNIDNDACFIQFGKI